jgi:hypothetical protein
MIALGNKEFFSSASGQRERGGAPERERGEGRACSHWREKEREWGREREKMRVFVDLIRCFPSHLN